MEFSGFIGAGYVSQSHNFDAQRCVNWLASSSESGTSKSKAGLFPTPGLRLFTTLPNGPVRGLWAGEGRLFAAGGSSLYEVFFNGITAASYRGEIGNDGKPVQMFPNGNQLGIVSAGKFYCDNGAGPTEVFFEGTAEQVLASSGTFLDSYFLVSTPNSRLLYNSDLNNGLSWDILDVATKEGYPDNIATLFADHEDLWVFGDLESTEVWRNNAAPEGLPFQRDPGAFIHYGCAAPYSVCRVDNGLMWLAGDVRRGGPIAVYAQGFQPKRISNVAVEQAWSGYLDTSDAVAYAYSDRGHAFWVISFPTGNSTWVYDATAGLWHERLFFDGTNFQRHRAAFHAFVGLASPTTPGLQSADHYVGDWQNGKIYTMSSDYFDDDGAPIVRLRTAPHLSSENQYQYHGKFELDCETGNGLLEPALRWSDDHGHSFNNYRYPDTQLPTAFGSRVIWRRLGKSRDRVYQLQIKSSIRTALVAAYIDITPGSS
jgi:hypothetical protein